MNQQTESGRQSDRRCMFPLRPDQREYLLRQATERAVRTGQRASATRVLQELVDRAIAAEKGATAPA